MDALLASGGGEVKETIAMLQILEEEGLSSPSAPGEEKEEEEEVKR